MPEGPRETGPVDSDVLERIARHLEGGHRFSDVTYRPAYAPESVVATYDLGYYPADVDRAYLRIAWFVTDDFTVHYSEQYGSGELWECRWDRHPNEHNVREHVHPPPNAATPGADAEYATDWRDVLARVLGALDERVQSFWE